jgi:two-component system sensor histidine kinase DesK
MNSIFGFSADGETRRSPRRGRAFGITFGLLFLANLGAEIVQYSGWHRIIAGTGFVVFLALYYGAALIRGSWSDPITPRSWLLYGLFATAALVLPLLGGSDWVGMPVYLSVLSAIFLPSRFATLGVGLSTAAAALVCLAAGTTTGAVWAVSISALSVGVMMLAFRHSRELLEQLRVARAEVARLAASEERLRIARDLHDLLGHSLSLIVLKSELAKRLAPVDTDRSVQEITDINQVARQALADVRETVSGYRRRSLAEELDSARGVLTAAGVEPVVRMSGTPLPPEQDALFAWVVREGVTNIVRHARASRAEISVTSSTVEISDNGQGTESYCPGNGLSGLGERISDAHGVLTSGPGPGGGFTVRVTL